MKLSSALRLTGGQAAAFVGAGGKSAAIEALVKELEGKLPLVVTTTTHLASHQSNMARHHMVGLTPNNRPQLESALAKAESILLTGGLNASADKWTALDPSAVRDLWALVDEMGGVLLIEADGARRKWIKAPAEHEPEIPEFVKVVVPIAGMHAWQKEISPEVAHRPEILAERLNTTVGTLLEDDHFAAWAGSPDLALKNIPSQAEVRILLNQVDNAPRLEAAHRIAKEILAQSAAAAVVVANIGRLPETVECVGRVGGVVLAAGGSSRFEGQKLLIEWRGKPLIRHVVERGMEAGLEPLVVVAGPQPDRIQAALASLPVRVVFNPDWEQGQSTSIRHGLGAMNTLLEGAIFLLADMPLVSSELLQDLMQAHRTSLTPIIAPYVQERWGNPVLFDRTTFDDLKRLEGDLGGRALFDEYEIQPVPAGEEALFDCDTQEDLAWLISHYP